MMNPRTSSRTPETPTPHPLMRYFEHGHLSITLQRVAIIFHTTAAYVDTNLPDGTEKTVALRKLLEAKDAAVRAALDNPQPTRTTKD